MQPILTKALTIFNSFGLSSIAMAITVAEFSLSMLRTLPTHLGAQFIKEMVTLFINVSSRFVPLSLSLSLSMVAATLFALSLFQGAVDPEQAGRHGEGAADVQADCGAAGQRLLGLLPSILDFSTQQILPLLQQQNAATDNSEITSLLYALFDR